MGISPYFAALIIGEHLFRPLPATVHLIGRQTVLLDYDEACRLMRSCGVEPHPGAIELDTATFGARQHGKGFITDACFFRMLGVEEVRAIDISDYEGADIVVDLNHPVPAEVHGIADFIFGGGVLDNIFDPAAYMRNVADLLRPGGRVIDVNVGTPYYHAYIVPSPAWYWDFFVLNGFCDCKIYLSEEENVYHFRPDSDRNAGDFGDGMGAHVVIAAIAEKGRAGHFPAMPNQDQYRSSAEAETYRQAVSRMASARPVRAFSRPPPGHFTRLPLRNIRGYEFIGVFDARSPQDFAGLPAGAALEEEGIVVLEASYGLNLLHTPLPHPAMMPLRRGNVTARIRGLCAGRASVSITVDCAVLGDPAPGMGKDLRVLYYYAGDRERRLREIHLPAEAHGSLLTIPAFPGS
jgi:SAM-dependent methyltransferase